MSKITIKKTLAQKKVESMVAQGKRYNCITKGRRFGFTHWLALFVIKCLLQGKFPILWGDTIAGNIDKYMQRYFLPVLKQLDNSLFKWDRTRRELRIANKYTCDPSSEEASFCDFRSADRPENWEGFGYKIIILNESGIILSNPYLYNNVVKPMMLDYPDSILIAGGVPKGKTGKDGKEHPFYSMYKKANENNPNYCHLNFTSFDNPFIDEQQVHELIEDLGGIDDPVVQQEILGKFVDIMEMKFITSFDEDKHVNSSAVYREWLPLYLSFDFNVHNTCTLQQHTDTDIMFIQEYKVGDLQELSERIMIDYPNAEFYIGGDCTGGNRSGLSKGNLGGYEQIQNFMNLGVESFSEKLSSVNPSHLNSRLLCNLIFKNENVIINPSCKRLIHDIKSVKVTYSSGGLKIDKSDAELTHSLDCLRYYLDQHHSMMLDKYNITQYIDS